MSLGSLSDGPKQQLPVIIILPGEDRREFVTTDSEYWTVFESIADQATARDDQFIPDCVSLGIVRLLQIV